MKYSRYTFRFKAGTISVWALGPGSARILAQAKAIERGWDYTIL